MERKCDEAHRQRFGDHPQLRGQQAAGVYQEKISLVPLSTKKVGPFLHFVFTLQGFYAIIKNKL